MADERRKQSGDQSDRKRDVPHKDSSEPVGDNRSADDVDGNAADGDSKSKGPTNPADEPPDARTASGS